MAVDERDAIVKRAVLRELQLDARVNESEIGVAVEDGIVTLTGRVDSDSEKTAAQEAAHRAWNVHDVANDIVVKVPFALGHNDADLAHAVRRALEGDVLIPADRIESTVSDAVVTLAGTVETRHAADEAERVAHRVAGVRRVDNQIAVQGEVVDLAAIRNAIQDALDRRAQREASRLELAVADGVVTVAGRMNSVSDKFVVLHLVRHAPGVRGVRDHLSIER